MNYGAYQSVSGPSHYVDAHCDQYYTKTAFPEASSAYIGIVGTINAFVSQGRWI
mgnify:CR=1 FL=1|jgi:hypothetical protein